MNFICIKISQDIITCHVKTTITLVHWHWTSKTGGGLNASFLTSSVAMCILLSVLKNRDTWAGCGLWHFRYFSSLIIPGKLTVACIFLWSIIRHWYWWCAGPMNAWAAVWGEKKKISFRKWGKTEDQVLYNDCVVLICEIFIRPRIPQSRPAWDFSEVLTE